MNFVFDSQIEPRIRAQDVELYADNSKQREQDAVLNEKRARHLDSAFCILNQWGTDARNREYVYILYIYDGNTNEFTVSGKEFKTLLTITELTGLLRVIIHRQIQTILWDLAI